MHNLELDCNISINLTNICKLNFPLSLSASQLNLVTILLSNLFLFYIHVHPSTLKKLLSDFHLLLLIVELQPQQPPTTHAISHLAFIPRQSILWHVLTHLRIDLMQLNKKFERATRQTHWKHFIENHLQINQFCEGMLRVPIASIIVANNKSTLY